jgi:hypothetical protein
MENQKLNPEFKAKWLAALRSGEYKQGSNKLIYGDKYCCLGVACAISGVNDISSIGNYGFISTLDEVGDSLTLINEINKVPSLLTGNGDVPRKLADMNDGRTDNGSDPNKSKSFLEIADYIEAHL